MERDTFARRLAEAAAAARDFARTFIVEPLPDALVFRVHLNSSYDGHPRVGDELVFPEDSALERAEQLAMVPAERVVAELWRDGRVPEWIDASVIGETGDATILGLTCCGRFTADDARLYHAREGRPPFHVVGPTLPVGYETGQKFSIYRRSECWSVAELDHLRPHAKTIWSLELFGRAFDDAVIAALPALPAMEILEVKASLTTGAGLAPLPRFPKLRVLRLGLDGRATFRIPPLSAPLSSLELFDIHDPPSAPWGFDELVRRAPRLSWLTLIAQGDLFVDGACPPKLHTLTIQAARLTAGFALPAALDSLHARLSNATDDDIEAWLAPVQRLRNLDLSGTPVTDALAERLAARFEPRYLNVVRTHVSEGAVRRLSAAYPKMKLFPNLSSSA